jgi:hypothetical protein
MRISVRTSIVAATLVAMSGPVLAIGLGNLGNLAKVVLGGGSVLKQGQKSCGSSLSLSLQDTITMAAAKEAVRKALPAAQFSALETASQTDAAKAAQSPNFCQDTVKKKPSLIEKIGNAAKVIGKLKGLGI